MKIAETEDGIICVDINTLEKFDLISDMLLPGVIKCIESAPYFNKSAGEYISILKFNIERLNKTFKLIVAINPKKHELVYFTSMFVVDDDGPALLIHSLWSKPGLIDTISPIILPYVDRYGIEYNCRKMLFHTAHNPKAFERVGKKYNWKATRTVFERSIAL